MPAGDQIRKLRKGLGLSQDGLARKLRVTANAVARWEQGSREPDGINCLKMARLLDGELAAFFLSRAGVEDAPRALRPEIRIVTKPEWRPSLEGHITQLVEIPVLREAAAAGSPREITERDVESFMTIPTGWARKGSGAYTCIRVMGNSMEPLLHSKDVVCIDHTRSSLSSLRGRLVASLVDGGVVVKRLDPASKADRIILLSENRDYGPIEFRPSASSRLIGAVVWYWCLAELRGAGNA